MRYSQVCIESFGYTLPDETWTSEEIEQRLEPLYQRLKLPSGRLQLMTGIDERRFWEPDILPSRISIESARRALEVAQFDTERVGALLHCSVCRDFLEPATACGVHHGLGISGDCVIYDVSNACLGILNGMIQVANMIELGQIRAGLVVGTEGGRQLVEATIDKLNHDLKITRQEMKRAVASLTIGSASCAVLLVDRRLSRTGNVLRGATWQANTVFHELCHSGRDEAMVPGMTPWMETDSERLMNEGVATGARTFQRFLRDADWEKADVQRTYCHQVGTAQRRLLFETLALDPVIDFPTLSWLGNTGSAALPVTMAIGCHLRPPIQSENVAMLGIGSGINCLMLSVDWRKSLVGGSDNLPADRLEQQTR